jgi:kumamolisin
MKAGVAGPLHRTLAGLLCLAALSAGAAVVPGTVRTPDATGTMVGSARIVRSLSADERSATMRFSVSLRMRDLAGLQARVGRGELVPDAELEATYLPLRSDYDKVAAWLASRGFQATLVDRLHTTVFVQGPVSAIASSLGVQFARVAVPDGEYTSAISEPSVPDDLAPVVLSVNGLQPEFRLRHIRAMPKPQPDLTVGSAIYIGVEDVRSAYNVPASATGAGQTIAIVGEGTVSNSDLNTFWTTSGSPQTASNVTIINVDGGPASNPDDTVLFETALDVEWAGGIAPAAKIRLYLAQNAVDTLTQISNDIGSIPSMRVVSLSYGNTEGLDGASALTQFSQQAATLAAEGVSILDASGDAGSNPSGGIGAGDYSATAPLGVTYPASDPSVTGVGGTTLAFTGNWTYNGEHVWNQLSDTSPSASGGGVSGFFPKPSWQSGGSFLAGQTMRCVPDVAAISDGDLDNVSIGAGFQPANFTDAGVLIVYDNGKDQGASGTSLAAPVWAGFTALINQSRATAGQGPIGLLNPHLYPLGGSSVFNDVTSGSNGAYSATAGYDLCTGLGSPNVANLISALTGTAVSTRLANISARAEVETGSNILIAGFYVSGPAGTTKQVLVRGVGPALGAFGVSGALSNPVLGVYDSSSALIASNTGWNNGLFAGSSTSAATFRTATATDMTSAGAFALTQGAADSAMVLTLPVGSYTVQVSGASGTGVALAEVYELDGGAPEVLANISARSFVGTGGQVAISGFIVGGTQPSQVLVRGIGPALAAFGVGGALAQPTVDIEDSTGTSIVSDTGWGNAPIAGTSKVSATFRAATAADMGAVNAFALAAGSADSAVVVTLPPGSYTAIVSGVGSTSGTGLAEVYQMSPH